MYRKKGWRPHTEVDGADQPREGSVWLLWSLPHLLCRSVLGQGEWEGQCVHPEGRTGTPAGEESQDSRSLVSEMPAFPTKLTRPGWGLLGK